MAHKILIVEDDDSILEALNFLMETAGYEVKIARDGLEGIKAANKTRPDVMILDVMLPGCDGFAVAQSVRTDTKTKNTPILMLTAKNRPVDMEKAQKLNVDSFMIKPFSTQEVVAKVKELLSA